MIARAHGHGKTQRVIPGYLYVEQVANIHLFQGSAFRLSAAHYNHLNEIHLFITVHGEMAVQTTLRDTQTKNPLQSIL